MVNIWKISTLALAGALAIVVGKGAVRESEACDTGADAAVTQTELRLSAALTFLDRAEQQIKAAPAARPLPRAKALEGIALAKAQVKKSLETPPDPPPPPPPRKIVNQQQTKVVRMVSF